MPDRVLPSVPPLTDRDLKLLAVFRAVAEAGGLTAAERALGRERSTISRQVKRLEERLGGTLCQRGPRGFELTEFGRAALRTADDLADAMAMARGRLAAARGEITGELRLGIADNCLSNPAARLPETLAAFAVRAPSAEIHLVVDAPSRLNRALLARELNVAIDGVRPDETRLEATPLFTEEFRLYAAVPPGNPTPHVRDLDRLGYGAVVRSAEGSPMGGAVARLGLSRQANASGLEAVATLIATGRYVGLLPTHMVEGLAARRGFVEIAGAEGLLVASRLMMLTERRRPAGSVVRALREAAIAAHGRPG